MKRIPFHYSFLVYSSYFVPMSDKDWLTFAILCDCYDIMGIRWKMLCNNEFLPFEFICNHSIVCWSCGEMLSQSLKSLQETKCSQLKFCVFFLEKLCNNIQKVSEYNRIYYKLITVKIVICLYIWGHPVIPSHIGLNQHNTFQFSNFQKWKRICLSLSVNEKV